MIYYLQECISVVPSLLTNNQTNLREDVCLNFCFQLLIFQESKNNRDQFSFA